MWPAAAGIGLVIGFLGGLLGKGGSAIATPMLHLVGFPAIVAVASPLPATVPSTMVAGAAYARHRLVDWRAAGWTVAVGVPSTVVGAVLTRWVGGTALVTATDVVLLGLGLRLLLSARRSAAHSPAPVPPGALAASDPLTASDPLAAPDPLAPVRGPVAAPERGAVSPPWPALVAVGTAVGLVSGLLANSGGFLLAPLFATVLRLPIRVALATSLAVASVLAVPGTVVHVALGHVDWALVAVFAATSVPLSFAGARVALRLDPARLEALYGGALVVLGAAFLALR